jgi:DNA-directed RNA polymerase sigma subunit (sigma70/sigma32)
MKDRELFKITKQLEKIRGQLLDLDKDTNSLRLLQEIFGGYENIRNKIDEMIKTLSEGEQTVIRLRFGLGEDSRTHTLKEVAEIFGTKRGHKIGIERIRQIESKALRKLQSPTRRVILIGAKWEEIINEAKKERR